MRIIPVIALLGCQLSYGLTYREEFSQARSIEKADPQGAAEGMIRCLRQATKEGSHEYAIVGGLNACHITYRLGKFVEAARIARETLSALEGLKDLDDPAQTAVRRVQMFGLIERGLLAEGKIGAALQANRAAAETFRVKKVAAGSDGPPITVREIANAPSVLKAWGLRIIEREADLLDLSGQSVEACKLLDEAAEYLGKEWQSNSRINEKFYAFKLLSSRAELMGFLGYDHKAIIAQQDLTDILGNQQQFKHSNLVLKMNLLRNLSKWNGPSEENLNQARAVSTELKTTGAAFDEDRLLARMEFDFKQSLEPLVALKEYARKNQELGNSLEASYADRDGLIARVKLGEPNLDQEFFKLLRTSCAQGNKRTEPGTYRSYGDYLLNQKRPAEAVAIYTEALRMTRGFGWVLHEPSLLGVLIEAHIAAGDTDGARSALAEVVRWQQQNSDAPLSRRVAAASVLAANLARLGELDAARAAYDLARKLGKDLPDYQKLNITPEQEALALNQGSPSPQVTNTPVPALRVQPSEVIGMAAPGETSRTRFSVFNPGGKQLQGNFIFKGPGARLDESTASIVFDAGAETITLKHPLSVPAGGDGVVQASIAPSSGTISAKVSVAWEHTDQTVSPEAAWEVSWSDTVKRSIVMDASRLESNPFRAVSIFHELTVPFGESIGIPFRLRSAVPLRFEYIDPSTGQLLAVDANGNGNFEESGDLYKRPVAGVSAAIFPVPVGSKNLTAEIRIFAPDGMPLATAGSTVILEAEVHRDGAWVKEAEDTLK